MTYEIVLTRKCTRRCQFCYIDQNDFVESQKNVDKFIFDVLSLQSGKNEMFNVNIFGGEPSLFPDLVSRISNGFKDCRYADVNLITNGDGIMENMEEKSFKNINIFVSAYDILENPRKYSDMNEITNRISFMYTFSENDLDKYFIIKDIISGFNGKFIPHLSHDPKSWTLDGLQKRIYDFCLKIIEKEGGKFLESNEMISSLISQHFRRYIQMHLKIPGGNPLCLDGGKMTFYNGRFIGPCIRFLDRKPITMVESCGQCPWNDCCSKSCMGEIVDGKVEKRLCTIEKTIYEFIDCFLKTKGDLQDKFIRYFIDQIIQKV